MDPLLESNPVPSPVAGPGNGVPAGKVYKSTPEQRRRWRLKSELARHRRLAAAGNADSAAEVERIRRELGAAPVGAVGVVPGPSATPGDPVGAPVVPVPWDSSVLQPLFATLVPEIEKVDVESLKAKAARIDPELASKVEADARWNPVARSTLTSTGPQVCAQTLNSMGISAEHGPAIALATAVASILASRTLLARKLDQLANRKRQSEGSLPPVPDQTGE